MDAVTKSDRSSTGSGPGAGLAVYLIGGTTEANQAARRLTEEGFQVTISVATSLGTGPAAAAGATEVDAGPKEAVHIASRAAELHAAAIVDCSHPFARVASAEASKAARDSGLPYLRYCRPPILITGERVTRVAGWDEAVEYLRQRGGRALLTVGTRQLAAFAAAGIDFTARILPVPESLAACRQSDIPPQRIIAAWPPFSTGFNQACIKHAGADILVSKEAGEEGGLPEKAAAAAAAGIELLLVERPPEPGAIHDLEQLVTALKEAVGV